MRINFNASYRDIERMLKASNRPAASGSGDQPFGKLLSAISPETRQVAETDKLSEAKAALNLRKLSNADPNSSPSEGWRPPIPEFKPPSLEPVLPLDTSVTPSAEGVKTPAVVDARRVQVPASLAVMKKGERVAETARLVAAAGKARGVDPALGMALVAVESAFNPLAVSKDGFNSKGFFQLLDSTGAEVHARLGLPGQYNPFDPRQNVEIGMAHLRYLHEVFAGETEKPGLTAAANSASLEKLAVAAFNAGEGRVAAAQQRAAKAGLEAGQYEVVERYLPATTQEYVQKVLAAKNDFNGLFYG